MRLWGTPRGEKKNSASWKQRRMAPAAVRIRLREAQQSVSLVWVVGDQEGIRADFESRNALH